MDKVSCRSCGTCVQVEKYSDQHTSVQWSRAAMADCTELSRVRNGGEGEGSRSHTCGALRVSIDEAVASGAVRVSTRDVDVRTRGRTLA